MSGRLLASSLLAGWGLFNVVEGVIDHHLLQIHHVYEPMGLSVWDHLFLLWGAAMLVGGRMLARSQR
jgi:uncharacterized membrane protein